MTRRTFQYALAGGLDEASQPLVIAPGRAIAAMNHETTDGGYARIFGHERFDGRTSPTDLPFYILRFTDGAEAITAGDTITGATSGATGIVLTDVELDAGAWDGTGVGSIGFRALTGDFDTGEDIEIGGQPVAIATGVQDVGIPTSGATQEQEWAEAARDYQRALITVVPGSGPVRGVVDFNGVTYAVRDNVGATAGVMHKSTATGWQAVNLAHKLDFTSGGNTEITVGQTVTGATSGATGVVRKVFLISGDWAAGSAAGYFIVSGITGTFVAENLNVGASLNLATIAAAPVAQTLPAGGRYDFRIHNFFGNKGQRAIYGVNGVGKAFEFDGTYLTPITTGMVVDTPSWIGIFRNMLFLGFAGGSLQHSGAADPFEWDPVVGTVGEIGIGAEITGLVENIDSLLIVGENGVFALTGSGVPLDGGSLDWNLITITLEAGGKPFTAQRFGPGLYLDNRGLRSVTATQTYGSFAMGSLSSGAKKTLTRKDKLKVQPVASCIVREKNHYRLFYEDGTGLAFYMGRKAPEAMPFSLGKIVRCIWSGEDPTLGERIFFGSDDGFVYQLEKGISFDGEAIEAYLQLAYAHMSAPDLLKRLFKIGLEVSAPGATTVGVTVDFDYASGEQSNAQSVEMQAYGSGGLWGIPNWGEFVWGAPIENSLEAHLDGEGFAISPVVYSNSALIYPYEVRGVRIYYGTRGNKR